jgi:1,4-alpha-glucan branching enzyme
MLAKMPGDGWQRFANLRAFYGFMWGHPGKKLLFMGQEFAQDSEWNFDAELPWALLEQAPHAGVQRLVRDLNLLYRARPALHRLDGDPAGFEWLIADDAERSVLAWLRKADDDGAPPVLVICNFTPVPRLAFRLGVPAGFAGWREVLNTDAAEYGGSDMVNADLAAQAQPQSIVMNLPPLACVFLVPV